METIRGRVQANGIELACQSLGPDDRELVLLIPGVSAQMDDAPNLLAQALVDRGWYIGTKVR